MKKILFSLLVLFFALSIPASAKIGVGVGTGKIEVSEKLKAGSISLLPSIVVINTGDEKSFYEVSIEYREGMSEMRPEKDWFIFEPKIFELNPGEQRMVTIKLKLPIKEITPGDYFAFVSASPVQIMEEGKASINVAAASRLYFTVDASNIFQAIYYRLLNFYSSYLPWSTVIITVIILALFVTIFSKKFKIQIAKK